MKVAVVIGVGASAGLGAAVARKFAQQDYHVVVAGRTESKLNAVVEELTALDGQATAAVCDATDASSLAALIDTASKLGTLDAVIANVGNNMPIPFEDLSEEQFEQFWRACTLSGFLTAKAALPSLEKSGGSLLFTGASASLRGRPMFGHFAAAKSALRTFAQALAREYGPKGVHVGHVIVDGIINGDMVKGKYEGYIEQLGEEGSLEPEAIAEAFWFLHKQPRNAWTFELDVRPFKENW